VLSLQKLLGHSDVKITADIYAHLSPDHAEVALVSFRRPLADVADLSETRRRREVVARANEGQSSEMFDGIGTVRQVSA
jgi:hypothetical protein